MNLYKWLKHKFINDLIIYIKTSNRPKWCKKSPSVTKWKERQLALDDIINNIIISSDYHVSEKYQTFMKYANINKDEYNEYTSKLIPKVKEVVEYASNLQTNISKRHAYIRKMTRKHSEEIGHKFNKNTFEEKAISEILSEETIVVEKKLQKELKSYINKFQTYANERIMPMLHGLKMLNMIEIPNNYPTVFSDFVLASRYAADSSVIKTACLLE